MRGERDGERELPARDLAGVVIAEERPPRGERVPEEQHRNHARRISVFP